MKDLIRSLTASLQRGGLLSIALLSATGLLFGCGTNDALEPTGDSFDDGHFISADGSGDSSMRRGGGHGGHGGGGRQPAQIIPDGDGPLDGAVTEITESKFVSTQIGGTLENGRYTMIVEPNTLPFPTEFKLTQDPDDSQIKVLLEPHATVFNVPVKVAFDLNGTDAYRHDNVRAQWFDEATGQWFDVPSVWDPNTQILVGYFDHFCWGRAGW